MLAEKDLFFPILKAEGQSDKAHIDTFVATQWQKIVHWYGMYHRKWIAEAVFRSVVAYDDVIYMHGSASWLWPLAAVYHAPLLYEKS